MVINPQQGDKLSTLFVRSLVGGIGLVVKSKGKGKMNEKLQEYFSFCMQ